MPLMMCPNCNVGMAVVERSGVHIDMCPQCRGVWLDRGELEKLLEPVRQADRACRPDAPYPTAPHGCPPPHGYPQSGHAPSYGHGGYGGHHGQHKKKSPWGELLDIFD